MSNANLQRCVSALIGWLLAALLAMAVTEGHSAELRWNGRPFQIVAADKPLPDFLRELASSQGTTAVVDPKVAGAISGKFNGSALKILDSVCTTNGLTWFYDGAFLFIEPASEARSEVLPVSNATRVADALKRLGIADSRYPVTLLDRDGQGSLHASGPKRYIEMVKQTVKLMDARGASADNAEIRLFPLRYAWAADFKIMRAGRETSIPGVANVLRSLYSKGGAAGGMGRAPSAPFYMGATRQLKLRTGDTIEAPKVELPGLQSDDAPLSGGVNVGSNELPQFQADTRMNAVIVRDLPERMDQYARLIQSMDVRPRLIEIEVTIMDISTDTLDSLGVDWRLHGGHGDLQFGRGNAPAQSWNNSNTEAGQTGPASPVGMVLNAALGHDARRYLLARVSALAERGRANFVARPKVLTLDNNEAVLENLSQFYVRVNGFQDASLFNVTTGTAVRVTPLIVDESAARGVMMSINIEDGDLSSASVDQIPIVRRRTVNTQALVDEGQSVLIAGYTSEEKTSATTGVPLLSDIPVVGRLFRYDEKKQTNMERFYLLTPRLVTTRGTPPGTLPVPTPAPGG
ncbi:type III secretion system outer membrane ring subunit SctC [Ideonella sp. BN130291]|uniref:type III secretion system outer membrane ring subunit SctC n=1 Tax=Ideonella sp. BN130291 TaxID=3112940 RepID=UPI002E25AC51|nr:type III secretion system outer membrane ring subunit SctC [Ideonella sp. BN130291]